LSDKSASAGDRITRLWRLVLTRAPDAAELAAIHAQLEGRADGEDTWAQVCQVLLMTGEFRLLY
jgi:hypothetical protein